MEICVEGETCLPPHGITIAARVCSADERTTFWNVVQTLPTPYSPMKGGQHRQRVAKRFELRADMCWDAIFDVHVGSLKYSDAGCLDCLLHAHSELQHIEEHLTRRLRNPMATRSPDGH